MHGRPALAGGSTDRYFTIISRLYSIIAGKYVGMSFSLLAGGSFVTSDTFQGHVKSSLHYKLPIYS